MRKSFILIAMMVAVNAWALTQKDGVYQIGTCQDLKDFSDLVNTKEGTDSYPNAGANAELTADIDMTTCGTINPIGAFRGNDDKTFTNNHSSNNFYSGHFAGNGHIISNLIVLKTRGPNIKVDIDTKEAYYAGLFGRVKEGVIEDVIVYNLKIDTKTNKDSYDYVGGIVGWLDNGSVLNCTIAGNSEITGRRNVGGVVGRAEGGTIKDCLSNVQLSSTGRGANVYVGGICGYASATTQLSSSVYVGSQIVRACVITDSCFCDEGGTSNEDVCKRDGTIIPHHSFLVPTSNPVYPGAHEYAIAGGDSLNVVDCYYDSDINPEYEENLWVEGDKKNRSMGMSDVNTAENICKLNGGTWSSSTCTGDDGPWTENGNITNHAGLQLNSDGTITIGAIFDANGGSFGSSGTSVTKWLNLGDDISAPNTNPTRTGYTFVGWGASNDATTPVTSFGTASGTKTFYALWSANSYTIVFNSNGGSEVASITADFGTTISAPDAPTMDGYVFGGWYSDATFTSAFTFSTMPAAEEGNTITLYAKWNQKYNLMIEVTEGTPALPDVANAYAEGELVTLVYPRLLSGFEAFFKFDHWEENYDDVTIAEDHSFTMPAHDVAVYAVYSPLKTRILYERCVECDESYQVDIDYGTEYTVKDASFDSAGYTQTGWAIEEGGAKVYDLNASVTFSDAMVRLFPVWTLNTYTITYKDGDTSLDGENNGGNPLSYNINSETIELNALGLKDISDVSNAKKFTGWYASSDFTGNPVTEISSGSIGDMTLYAKYETVYQVGYFLNGGQGRDWYFPGEPIRDIKPEGTQNFYCEWFLNSGDHPDTIPTHAPASNDLYEVCYADYPVDIVFDPNGGAFANPSYTGGKEFYGVDIDLSKFGVPELSREGYRFLGWSRSSDASAPDYSFGKVDNPTGVTFYAVWKRVYTVTFDKNGHGDDVTAQVVDSLDKATKPDNLAATGYEFGGWFVDGENFTTEYDFNTSVGSDLTLHAKWSATVSFDMNGYGTQVESQKVIVGKTATIPTVPTAEGFLFSGWYTDDSFAQEFDFAAPVTAAIELHAKWLPAVIITIDATSSKKYNGEEQTIGYTVENLPEGYHLVCNASSTNVTASSVDVTCDKIADAEGHDVTSQFGLIFTDDRKTGALTIVPATENAVTVELEGWTYGSSSVPTPDVSATFHAAGEPVIKYAKKGADTTNTANWSSNVPTDAGEYYVKATVAGTDNYVGGGATAEFSITAKSSEGFVVTFSPESATYTGNDQTPTVTVKDGDNTLTVGKDYTVTWSETPNAAGTYTATVTGAGNYTGTKTGSFTVGKDEVATTNVSIEGWTYGEASKTPVADGIGASTATFEYAKKGADTTKAENWSATAPTEAGEYIVRATIAGTDNYVAKTGTAEFSITAKSSEGFVVTFSPESATYTGNDQTPTVTVKDGDNTLTVGKDYTVTWSETPNAAGTYTATVTYIGDYSGTKTGSFTVGKDEVATTNVSIEGWTYGETPSTPSASGIGAETATFEYAKKDADTTKAENWSATAPTEAGEYYVKATIAGTDNYAAKSGTAEFSIDQREVQITWSETSQAYTGATLVPTATITNLVGSDACNLTLSDGVTDAGSGTVTVVGLDNPNYKLPSTAPSTTFTVTKATENTVSVSLDDWTYGSTSVPTPDVSATFHAENEPVIKYAKKDADTTKAESWSATVPTDAGEYYVKATVAGTDNYVGGSDVAEFSITAKSSEGFVVTFSPESATYTGDNQTPTITVKDGETMLTAGKDYTVTWSETPNAAGTYTATVTGKGDYSGTKTGSFTVGKDEVATTNVSIEGWTYGEASKTPVADGIGASTATFEYAKKGADTTKAENWSATAPTEAGEYIVRATIVGTDNYAAKSGTAEFTIGTKSSEGFVVTFDPASATYTGNDQTPTVTVKDGDNTLTVGKDYTVAWSATPNAAGTYTATVTYIGDYSGTKTESFTISKDEVATTNVTIEGWTYGETAKTPVADGIGASTATFEYAKKGEEPAVWSATAPTEAGEYIVRATIVGTDNYVAKTGTAEFSITAKSSEGFVVTFSPESATYTGNDQTPTVTVKDGETTLTAGKDYTVTWSETPNAAGTYTATVTYIGDYSGTKTGSFTISKDEVATTNVTIEGWTYGETAKTPVADGIGASTATFEYAKKGADTTKAENWSATAPTEAGEYIVRATIVGTDNYVAKTGTAEFTIGTKSSEGFVVTFSPESATYTGNDQTPTVTVKDGDNTLTVGKDYTVTWSETPNAAGTYTATVTGKGDYSGTKTGSFTVGKDEVATTNVTIEGWTYGETAKTPVADGIGASTATFEYAKKGEEPAAWSATAPTEAGEYIVRATIAGTDNYVAKTGTAEFTIAAKSTEGFVVTFSPESATYTGNDQTPTITVKDGDNTLTVGKDYTVAWSETPNAAGTYTATVTYIGDYSGTKTESFTISKDEVATTNVTIEGWTYGETAKTPVADGIGASTATFEYAKKGADTTKAESWSATAPTEAGEYIVRATIVGTDNYAAKSGTAEFTIGTKSSEGFVVTFSPESATYTGNDQTPTVTVKDGETTLTAGKDYTVTWSETPNAAGTYTATVTYIGDYSGTKTGSFTVGKDEVATTNVSIEGWTYGETAKTPVADGIGASTATFEYAKKGEEPAAWSATAPTEAGEYIVRATIAGTDNYVAKTGTAEFTIDQREVQITWSDISQAYTGATLVPTATITNLVGSDACGLTLSDGVTDAGSGTVTVVGLDNPNYKLPSTAPSTTFTVTKATENAVSVSLDDWTYGSTSVPTPDVSATFHAENEPVVKYAKKDADTTKAESWSATVPTDAGEYYVKATVAGTDNYVGGGATAEFSITAKSTEGFVVTFDPASATYTGNDQTPTITVKDGDNTLTAGKDYTVTWSETPNAAGTYTATVTGKGDYSGTKTAEFTVGPKSVSEFVVSVNPTNFVYTGSALTPTITVKDGDNTLTVGTDYTVSGLENVVGVGSYEVTVSGTGNYKETATATFTVSPVITMSLGDGETLACTEGAKGFAACNAAHDNIVHVYGTATAELPDAEKSGWTFAGWYDNASFANAKIESIAADRVDGLTLYPKFVKEITIVYGEGAGDKLQVEIELDDSEEDVVKKVEAALAAAGVSPTKTDDSDSTYAFDKWNVDGDTWTAEFKGTVKTEEIVVVYGADPTKDTIHVTVDVPDNAETRLAKVDADLEKKGVSPTKAEDSDSTYAFDKWNVDGDTWTAEFKGSVKTEEIVVVYGADPTKDTIHVTVDVPDNAETRIAKVEAELEKKGVSPTKAEDSDSTYAFDKWNVDGDTWTAEFKATPKYIEVVVGEDTVKVIVPKGESGEGSDPSGEIAVDVVLVVDGDTVKTVVKDGDVLDSIARDTLGHNPTKAETKDSTYEFAGWEPVVDDEGKPVVDKNGNVIYEPVFESEVKKDTIRVVTDDGDTVEVVIHVPDSDEQVQQKIGDEFKAEDIPLPTKDSDVLYSYKFDKFVKNVETGLYEASFKKLSHSFTITYKMPKRGVLLEDVLSYNYGEETILPQARIEGDDEWEFKGWYTKRDGLGDRSKKILSTDDGDKVFYPLFQKPIAYEINGKKGVVMIIYTEEEEKYVNRALESIIPEDYEKKGVTMTFDKWVLEDGVYVAKFTQAVGFKTALAPRFTVNVIDRVLEINGARMGAKIDVFDMRGRLVSTSLVQNGTTNVEIAKSGSYIVRVDNQAHRVDVR